MPLTQVKTSNLDTTNSLFFRNRIINGAMVIDQRNAGASVAYNAETKYSLDRWNLRYNGGSGLATATVQQSSSAPAGFKNSLLLTVGTAKTPASGNRFNLEQAIEANNITDLMFGTSNAQTVTVSFWVKSSLTGSFGFVLGNLNDRAYCATYTITAANTWEYKTITIPGCTDGTWNTTGTSGGIYLHWDLGNGSDVRGTAGSWNSGQFLGVTGTTNVVATTGATWSVTGLQLEVGTAATAFERRPFTTELQLCQRYFEKSYDIGVVPGTTAVNGYIISPTGTNTVVNNVVFNGPSYKVNKRITNPTIVIYGYSGGTSKVSGASTGGDLASNSGILNSTGESTFSVYNNSGSSLTTNSLGVIYHFTSSAEL